jgi:hypothetical protein
MPRLSKQKIRRLVMQELARVVGEDALVNRVKDMNRDTGYDDIQRVRGANAGMHASCSQCGSTEVYEGECMECGATGSRMLEGKMCEQCGSSDMYEGECMECGYSKGSMLEEGGCGCGTCSTCSDNDMDDDFIPDYLEQGGNFPDPRPDHDFLEDDITHIVMGALGHHDHDHGENELIDSALGTLTGLGYHVDAHKDPGMPAGYVPSHNNYMAKPSLFKVAKYAQKLLQMIPDGYELDDWQRTKIAQISDDISEVYHSLDYDFHDDEF